MRVIPARRASLLMSCLQIPSTPLFKILPRLRPSLRGAPAALFFSRVALAFAVAAASSGF